MKNLNLSSDAASFLTDLEAKQSRQLWNKIVSLMKNSRPNDSLDIGNGRYRTTAGEYRIVYSFDDTVLYISVVGKRNDDDVYKQAARKKR